MGFQGKPGIGVVERVICATVGVDVGGGHVQGGSCPAATTAPLKVFLNTIGTPAGGLFGKPAYAVVVVYCGNQLAAVGAVALPVLNCGCTTPATDGGTAAGTTGSGAAFGPTGTATGAVFGDTGGKVGGGGTPPAGGGVGVVNFKGPPLVVP